MNNSLAGEGIIMESETKIEMSLDYDFCPECGAKESGYFCRKCGSLLRGEEMILCPRCHRVVPEGDYCNQCGQSLGGLALRLRQLAMAGDAFWITTEADVPRADAEGGLWEPDETVELAEAELPDWLQELPAESAPADVESRIYPALEPIREEHSTRPSNTAFIAIIVLAFVLLLGMVLLAFIIALNNMG
jgi:hypothetical protein